MLRLLRGTLAVTMVLAWACGGGHPVTGTDAGPMDAGPTDGGPVVTCATTTCGLNAHCVEEAPGATCLCNTGYAETGVTRACTDVDECATDNGGCQANSTCSNTDGSFECDCDMGFVLSGGACVDSTPCEDHLDNCLSTNAVCTDGEAGTFTCACATGYTGDGVTSCVLDTDGDGIPDATDNCPTVFNQDQADTDNDAKGDACDVCPINSNPGDMACPSTVYAIKSGDVADGTSVSLADLLVTGRNSAGYFVQVPQGNPGYDGSDFSGLFVADGANTVSVGDEVYITSGTVTIANGQITLTDPVTNVASSSHSPPDPISATTAQVSTGGSKAAALDGVIVTVSDVAVTDIAPPVSAGDSTPTNEFVVDGALRVNDFLYLITPFPGVGEDFSSLTGILHFANGESKLELTGASDIVPGSPFLISFGPAESSIDVGAMGATTTPQPLTVQLAYAPSTATFISITSGDTDSLTVVSGGVVVNAGETSAQVLLNGLAESSGVTLTATLGSQTLNADVAVVNSSG